MIGNILRRLERALGHGSASDKLVRAHKRLEENRFPEATTLLREIVSKHPDNAAALNLLGFALLQAADARDALPFVERAIALNPSGTGYHSNLGAILAALGRPREAEEAYRRQVRHTPLFGTAHLQLAELLLSQGREGEALTVYADAIDAIPDLHEARMPLAWNALTIARDFKLVIKLLDPVLQKNPGHEKACLMTARAHLFLNDFNACELALRGLLKEDAYNIEALESLGYVLLQCARAGEAEACFRIVLGIQPENEQAIRFLGSALLETGRLDQAGDLLAAIPPPLSETGTIKRLKGRHAFLDGSYEKAQRCYEEALLINPDDVVGHEQLANVRFTLGFPDEALALMRKALALDPHRQMTHYNYAFALLITGKFRQGLIEFESRLRIPYEDGTPFNLRAAAYWILEEMKRFIPWDGKSSPRGKPLLVWREQGFGDTLMMMRFLRELRSRGVSRLCVVAQPELIRVIESLRVADEVVDVTSWNNERLRLADEYELHCSMMSLPYLLGVHFADIRKCVPYLNVEPDARDYWKTRLAQLGTGKGYKKSVGLVWAGNPQLAADRTRSIALSQLSSLLAKPDIQWVSLQKGSAAAQAQNISDMCFLIDECTDFMDTAGLIAALDLVIAVDTAIVHLAGALGRPVWMFNRVSSEWRWLCNREDSPWYPSLRLFNQKVGESWQPVVQRVEHALADIELQRETE